MTGQRLTGVDFGVLLAIAAVIWMVLLLMRRKPATATMSDGPRLCMNCGRWIADDAGDGLCEICAEGDKAA